MESQYSGNPTLARIVATFFKKQTTNWCWRSLALSLNKSQENDNATQNLAAQIFLVQTFFNIIAIAEGNPD